VVWDCKGKRFFLSSKKKLSIF